MRDFSEIIQYKLIDVVVYDMEIFKYLDINKIINNKFAKNNKNNNDNSFDFKLVTEAVHLKLIAKILFTIIANSTFDLTNKNIKLVLSPYIKAEFYVDIDYKSNYIDINVFILGKKSISFKVKKYEKKRKR